MSTEAVASTETTPVPAEPVADAFVVSVQGAGIDVSREVDQATALSVIATVLGGANSYGRIPPQPAPGSSSPANARNSFESTAPAPAAGLPDEASQLDPRMTVGEYIDSCEAQQYPAKITAIGNYLELRKGIESFSKDDIKAQFRPAGEAPPGNFSRDFNEAITRRWIAAVPEDKDSYFVTNTGKSAIAAKFDRSMRRASPALRRKKSAKENGDRSAALQESTDVNLDDL